MYPAHATNTTYFQSPVASILTPQDDLYLGVFPRSAGFWAVFAYMSLYIVRPWEKLIPELAAISFERLIYIVVLIVIMASSGLHLRMDKPTLGVLGFAAALLVTTFTAQNTELAWGASDGLYVYLTKLFALVIIVSVVRTPYQLFFLVALAVVAVSLYAGKSLWEYLIHGAGITSMGVRRLHGTNETFGHPNAVAVVLLSSLPWWLFLYRSRETLALQWPTQWKKRFHYFVIAVPFIFITCIYYTGSRAGTIGLIVFLLLSFGSAKNRGKFFLFGLLGLAIAWTQMGDDNKQRIRSIWDSSAAVAGGEESAEGRKQGFLASWATFEKYPLTGVGIGNFGTYRKANIDGSHLVAHNIPGEVLGETGLIGTVAFIAMLTTLFSATSTIRRIARQFPDPTTEMFASLAVAFRHTIYLLLLLGLANNLSTHFSWIWVAAFCSCMLWLIDRHIRDIGSVAKLEPIRAERF